MRTDDECYTGTGPAGEVVGSFWPTLPRATSARQEALEGTITLEQAASHAHICSKLAEQYKSDALLFAALTDAASIIQDLLRDRLQESQIADPVHSDRALRLADECEESARLWAHEIDTRQMAAAELRRLHAQAAQDEALLRQALERLEAVVEHFDPYMGDNECRPMENARYTIAALRERLGVKA